MANLDNFLPHSKQTMDNVNNLSRVKTYTGKGRAWIRCSLVEKTLESYLSALMRNKKLTADWFEPWSVLRTGEEQGMLLAYLAPLSVVNFSICMKDIDFDNLPNNLGTASPPVCFHSIPATVHRCYSRTISLSSLCLSYSVLSRTRTPSLSILVLRGW